MKATSTYRPEAPGGYTAHHPKTFRDVQERPLRLEDRDKSLRISTKNLVSTSVDIETKTILKACVRARAALAALRQATALIPNPAVLINTIPLLEAQASSEIENIVTTTDALFRHAQLESLAPQMLENW